MTKKNNIQAQNTIAMNDDFDMDMFESYNDGSNTFVEVMKGLLDGSAHQTSTALELTKLIVESTIKDNLLKADDIFAIYEKSLNLVSINSPTQALMEQMKKA